MADTYKIVRFYAGREVRRGEGLTGGRRVTLPGLTGLTLEQAQEHCKDPETSSTTCTKAFRKALTKHHGAWFEGYTKE